MLAFEKDLRKALKSTFEHRGETLPTDLAEHLSGLQRDLLQRGTGKIQA